MTGTKKNKYRYSCLVVTGNRNGLGGEKVITYYLLYAHKISRMFKFKHIVSDYF